MNRDVTPFIAIFDTAFVIHKNDIIKAKHESDGDAFDPPGPYYRVGDTTKTFAGPATEDVEAVYFRFLSELPVDKSDADQVLASNKTTQKFVRYACASLMKLESLEKRGLNMCRSSLPTFKRSFKTAVEAALRDPKTQLSLEQGHLIASEQKITKDTFEQNQGAIQDAIQGNVTTLKVVAAQGAPQHTQSSAYLQNSYIDLRVPVGAWRDTVTERRVFEDARDAQAFFVTILDIVKGREGQRE